MTYTWPAARAALGTAFQAEASLSGWEVYEEPPEQLAGGRCIVIAPRSPYRTMETLGTGATHLAVHVLVPRSGGPAMDVLDAGLAGVLTALLAIEEVTIGDTIETGLLEEVGGLSYLVTTVSTTYE